MNNNRTCQRCRHWVRLPADPQNLGQQRGECRAMPPQLITTPVMTPHGPAMQITATYPQVPPEFPACGQFAVAVLVDGLADRSPRKSEEQADD